MASRKQNQMSQVSFSSSSTQSSLSGKRLKGVSMDMRFSSKKVNDEDSVQVSVVNSAHDLYACVEACPICSAALHVYSLCDICPIHDEQWSLELHDNVLVVRVE
jgi:hypothetical protein